MCAWGSIGFNYNLKKLNISKHILHVVFYLGGSKNGQNRPKFSCKRHLLSNSGLAIGYYVKENLDVISAPSQSKIWNLCCLGLNSTFEIFWTFISM